MIIKTDEFELEIFQGADVYFGSKKTGQTFKKWSEIDESTRAGLERIVEQAETLIRDSENLLVLRTAS